MRLDKFLAEAGIGKRKVVREEIKKGLVKVNNTIFKEPAFEIKEREDKIYYKDKLIEFREKVYYMFNKPMGCVTAVKDDENKTVFDYFNDDVKGIFHVGRLDKDTEGLLLLTNDGEFEHALMHPDKHINKTYFFWALGCLKEEDKKSLENGIYLEKGKVLAKPAKIDIYKQGNYLDFKNEIYIDSLSHIDTNKYNPQVAAGYLTISEGKKHQVKRMLKEVGCHVVYLKRVAVGEVKLDESLGKGEYRKLTKEEIKVLMKNSREL